MDARTDGDGRSKQHEDMSMEGSRMGKTSGRRGKRSESTPNMQLLFLWVLAFCMLSTQRNSNCMNTRESTGWAALQQTASHTHSHHTQSLLTHPHTNMQSSRSSLTIRIMIRLYSGIHTHTHTQIHLHTHAQTTPEQRPRATK